MQKEAKYSTGDLVTLKSGGPTMTVDEVVFKKNIANNHNMFQNEDEYKEIRYVCKWFAGKKVEREGFSEDMLRTATTEQKK